MANKRLALRKAKKLGKKKAVRRVGKRKVVRKAMGY